MELGNALAWVQRVHKTADLWDITFCTYHHKLLLRFNETNIYLLLKPWQTGFHEIFLLEYSMVHGIVVEILL